MSTSKEALADMRRRVADGESIPREEIEAQLILLREDRAKKTEPKKPKGPPMPADLASLFKKPVEGAGS